MREINDNLALLRHQMAEHQLQNNEQQRQITEHQLQNNEHQRQMAEHQRQNNEQQRQITEQHRINTLAMEAILRRLESRSSCPS